MSSFDEKYKFVTGMSRSRGVVSGFFSSVGSSFHKTFMSSPHSRLRSGLAVLSLAGIITYLFKGDVVDAKLDSWKSSFVEYRDDRMLLKEERRASNKLDFYVSELRDLENEYGSLLSEKENLSVVVSGLEKKALVESRNSLNILDSLNGEINYSKFKLDSLNNVISSYSSDNVDDSRSRRSLFGSSRKKNSSSQYGGVSSSKFKNDGLAYSGSGNVWVGVPEGSSLSAIASKYHGDFKLYKELARLNNISNPDFVLKHQPVQLLDRPLKSHDSVFEGDVPLFEPVSVHESLDGFLKRTGLSDYKNVILDYNISRGNLIPSSGRLVKNTGVVYLNKDWSR